MKTTEVGFPIVIIILFLGASITSFASKDYGKMIYWLCSAAITFCVTFLME